TRSVFRVRWSRDKQAYGSQQFDPADEGPRLIVGHSECLLQTHRVNVCGCWPQSPEFDYDDLANKRQRSQLRERVAKVIVARRPSGTGCKQAFGTPSRRYVRVWHLADIDIRPRSAFGGKADIPNSLPYVC